MVGVKENSQNKGAASGSLVSLARRTELILSKLTWRVSSTGLQSGSERSDRSRVGCPGEQGLCVSGEAPSPRPGQSGLSFHHQLEMPPQTGSQTLGCAREHLHADLSESQCGPGWCGSVD